MKAYLATTAVIFGLFAVGHVFELLAHWTTWGSDKWLVIGLSLIAVISGALCIWALVLLKFKR